LMLYISFNFILQLTLGFYYAFFPMYMKELGGDNLLLGWSMLISSMSEVPFLLFANKIFKYVKIPVVFMVAAVATALRWYFFSIVETPSWILPVQALHGMIFIVLTVTLATYINQEVPKELKASGQTFNGLLNFGVTRIIGSFFGGIAIYQFGLRDVFLFNSIIAMVCVVVFGLIFWRIGRRAQTTKETV
jgi:MFS transporter, PPP family, 3-phenylpropionic acid transporter